MNNTPNTALTRRMFTLGGFQFNSPSKIGSGPRFRVQQRIQEEMLNSKIAELLPDVREMGYEEAATQLTRIFTQARPYDTALLMMEECLTPEPGSPSVKDAFEIADDEEVNAILNFMNGISNVKTSVDGPKIKSGTGHSLNRKRAKSR